MREIQIAIVGGGLSGLYAAFLLEQLGVTDYVVLEARERIGGRIAHLDASGDGIGRFDLGAAWFWPGYQPELDTLVDGLGLQRFAQYEAGDMLVERTPADAPMRVRGFVNVPASMRLLGGMGTMTDALYRRLDPARIVKGQAVRRLRKCGQYVELDCDDGAGTETGWRAGHVLLALPPRLAEHSIAFEPALPAALAEQWRATPTWMAPHAKYVAVYDRPFWRKHGLSGEARSARGPLAEIHDASTPDGGAALFGFFGIHAQFRQRMSGEDLLGRCRAQLVRLFGPAAGAPLVDIIKDWASDPFTATQLDLRKASGHPQPPDASAASGVWRDCLTGIGSEWSTRFPGYLAGAIDAAERGVRDLLQRDKV